MKNTLLLLFAVISIVTRAQSHKEPAKFINNIPGSLPPRIYQNLKDSCTQVDIVFYTGVGGSMSLDGKNVRMFTSFVSPATVLKRGSEKQDGHIMWQINGKEYITGKMFLTGDSSGYLVFNKDNKEYINALVTQGAGFLHTHGKKK